MRPPSCITERPADEFPAVAKAEGSVRIFGRFSRPKALPAHLAGLLRGPCKAPGTLLSFGDPRVDGCLGGGLALGQLHEVGAAGLDAEIAALPAGFIAALLARVVPARPVFWIASESDLHPPGLLPYGFDANRLVLVHPPRMSRRSVPWRWHCARVSRLRWWARWGSSTAPPRAACSLPACAMVPPVSCCAAGRMAARTADREASVAVTRWRLAPMPSLKDGKGPGLPRWRVALTHARGGRPGEWIMEASDDATHPLRVVAALADHAPAIAASPPRRIGR